MDTLITSLEDNLKDLYRKAIDADKQIDELKQKGLGKFEAIFKEDSPFQLKSNKFMPYLEQVAEQILNLKESEHNISDQPQKLESVVKKLHLLHTTLAEFKQAIK